VVRDSEWNLLFDLLCDNAEEMVLGEIVFKTTICFSNLRCGCCGSVHRGVAGADGDIKGHTCAQEAVWMSSATWDKRHAPLRQFMTGKGHCNVPRAHKEDGDSLGAWVTRQRHLKKARKLDSDCQKNLEEIGFEWFLVVPWKETFSSLKQFKKREGHCDVPKSHKEDGANLGAWTNNQRRFKKIGKLNSDRDKLLEEVGFQWSLSSATWDEMHGLLKQFMTREEHCKVPQLHKEDGAKLGPWVTRQRQLKKTGKLDADRQMRPEEVSPAWGLTVKMGQARLLQTMVTKTHNSSRNEIKSLPKLHGIRESLGKDRMQRQ
jgi:hypothetical protein